MPNTHPPHSEATEDVRAAYEQGRLDQRAERKRHPIAMTITFAAAAVGVVILALAAANGSFSRSGELVDQQLAEAKAQAQPIVRDAAENAGQAVRDATKR